MANPVKVERPVELEYDCANEMRIRPAHRVLKEPPRYARDVTPQRLPLVVLVPHIRPLEQRHDKPLRLRGQHLRRADLPLHTYDRFLLQLRDQLRHAAFDARHVAPAVTTAIAADAAAAVIPAWAASMTRRAANWLRLWTRWSPAPAGRAPGPGPPPSHCDYSTLLSPRASDRGAV